jgi:integrase
LQSAHQLKCVHSCHRQDVSFRVAARCYRKHRVWPISEVSRWLGHKSITTTVDLYGHLVPEATGRARDALDNAFRRATADVPGKCPDRS